MELIPQSDEEAAKKKKKRSMRIDDNWKGLPQSQQISYSCRKVTISREHIRDL